MEIVCTSDLHGNLPTLPKGDLLLIAGDVCPIYNHEPKFQSQWIENTFYPWCQEQPFEMVVFIAGNHDFYFEGTDSYKFYEEKYPKVKYLQDSFVMWHNLKIWGTPHQREFGGWAFNEKEERLAELWELIPKETDVIVCHGPAFGYGDRVMRGENVGSPSMLKKIEEIKPKLYVCGHIHEGYGIRKHNETWMVNASLVNSRYMPTNMPIIVKL
jgi:Icc-related predicted phosphoesterase